MLGAFHAAQASADGPLVKTVFDKKTDFAAYRTFAIQDGSIQLDGKTSENNSAAQAFLREELTSGLSAKGLKSTKDNPDLIVTYVSGVRSQDDMAQLAPLNFEGGWGPGMDTYDFYAEPTDWNDPGFDSTYSTALTVIDFLDRKTGKRVWRAYVKEFVQIPERQAELKAAVTAALAKYPPKP